MTGASNATGPQDAAAAATALRGASLAFSKKKPAPPPPAKDNGALTAATTVGRPRSPPPSSASAGAGAFDHDAAARHQQLLPLGTSGLRDHPRIDPKSPSLIAATLAASRSASPTPKPRTPLRKDSLSGTTTPALLGEAVDSGSIPPTGSLISMFEQAKGNPGKKASPAPSVVSSLDERAAGRHEGAAAHKARLEMQRTHTGGKAHDKTPTTPVSVAAVPDLKPKPQHAKKPSLSKPVVKAEESSPAPAPKPKAQAAVLSKSPSRVEERPSPKPKPFLEPTKNTTPTANDTVDHGNRTREPPSTPIKPAANGSAPPAKPSAGLKSPPLDSETKPKPRPKLKPISPPPVATTQLTPAMASPTRYGTPRKPATPSKPISQSKPELASPRADRTPKHNPTTDPVKPSPRIAGMEKLQSPMRLTPASPVLSAAPKRPPTPPMPRGSQRKMPAPESSGRRQSVDSVSSDDTFVSASSVQSPERLPTPPPPRRKYPATASEPSSPTRGMSRPARPSNSSTANLPVDSLASAIVASSLASARLTPHSTGGTLAAPPLPSRQKSPRLRPTLRRPVSTSDDESDRHTDRHKKGALRGFQRGKHAHHEGSRKKWREEITLRERKRYEAVWASNRGVLLPSAKATGHDLSQHVANVVVREIWKRSRLPDDELAEVWDLVDRSGTGMLDRQEFVVGMWLIDQRLRGRKIPAKVSDSVWGSANGVRVIQPKGR
ncbi:hypothetical protein B0I35DRAFT_443023 [Stachybotrys elegans]|uniref:EH domain-containing protein n=1 Tax=Stachybotrys elegans TaxID=80388 RepID=A0A8K0WM38_9HYPO|nr:hypothetical protein B0I35DRAFT_443023 [Stachybotrys elegans]